MSEPLWSNERIAAFANNAPSAWEARRLYDAMCKIRDDYEAKLPASDDVLEAIRESLQDREYALSAYYDGEPRALADAAKCREAMAWIETLRPRAESGGEE